MSTATSAQVRIERLAMRAGIGDLARKVFARERLSREDGVRLYRGDLHAVGALANHVRERMHGDLTYFNVNQHINYTNICNKLCRFCAFQRLPGQPGAYAMTPAEAAAKIRAQLTEPVTEVHMVAGIHPKLAYEYYLDLLRAVKAERPSIHIKAFTMVELDQIAKKARKPLEEVLPELIAAGLGSVPGGGAEIFRKEVRSKIATGKESAEEYLAVHDTWHALGGRSTCTMLYGHVESPEDRIDHLDRLRRQQDRSGGFTGFIPLPYQPDNNRIPVRHGPSGFDQLRTLAVSRLYLDNFDHVTAYWVGMGLKMAQIALSHGADDVHGTIVEEHIFHMAGAKSPQGTPERDLVRAIREAGRIPVQRNTFYEPIRVWDAPEDAATSKATTPDPAVPEATVPVGLA